MDATAMCGMEWQTLRDWVHRHNDEGLSNCSALGPVTRLSNDREAELARWVETGPELERDAVVR
jgi:hypothetical protein